MDLYQAIASFLNREGIDLPQLAKLNGIHYENIILKVTDSGGRKFRLFGGKGTDTLLGGAGPDSLVGGKDRDFLMGGADKDRFVFDGSGVDVVMDFRKAI